MPTTTKQSPKPDTDVQDQILDGIRQTQQAVIDAVRAWSEATAKLAPDLPAAKLPESPVDLPEPKQVVASTFDFAEKLQASQREFTEQLLTATAPPAKG